MKLNKHFCQYGKHLSTKYANTQSLTECCVISITQIMYTNSATGAVFYENYFSAYDIYETA